MAYNIFLKITPDIEGDSKTEGKTKQIEVTSWNFGVSNGTHIDGSSKVQTGMTSIDAIHVRKKHDASTAPLMKMCAMGKKGAEYKGVLTVTISGEKPQDLLTITMTKMIVANVATGGSKQSEGLEDTISLFFTKIEYEYQSFTGTGGKGTKPKFGYDLELQTLL